MLNVRIVLKWSSALLLSIISAAAYPYQYNVSYTGGTYTVGGQTYNDSPGGGGYGGGFGGAGSCQGEITISFDWSGPRGSEPEGCIVMYQCSASASAVMGSSSTSNGLSAEDAWLNWIVNPYVWSWESRTGYLADQTTRRTYYLGNKSGSHFEIKVTPTASTNMGPGGSVFVSASATPITLNLTGPIPYGGAATLAVGQKLTAQ